MAILGMSCRLPASTHAPARLMAVVSRCVDAASEVPASRWQGGAAAEGLESVSDRTRHGAFVCGAESFDSARFGISAAEAGAMDPQQRLVLECSYAALGEGGLQRGRLMGSGVGVGVGIYAVEYGQLLAVSELRHSVYASTGASLSIASGRLSFVLGLVGPCVSFETACSAALVALDAGVHALRLASCEAYSAAGVNLMLLPASSVGFAVAGMTSVRGRCHTFDRRADGFARADGCGAVCAERAGMNSAMAVAVGSAVRQDGRSASLTAPNGQAQGALLAATLGDAETTAAAQNVCEAHGTGTALGDPIEVGAVGFVLLASRCGGNCEPPLGMSSIKASHGHGESTAGMSGLLVLCGSLRPKAAAPNAQLRVLNPRLGTAVRGGGCALSTQTCAGLAPSVGCAAGGVSSFGYSGTIAHALLRGAPVTISTVDLANARSSASRRRFFPWQQLTPSHRTVARRQVSTAYAFVACWNRSQLPLNTSHLPSAWALLLQAVSPSGTRMVDHGARQPARDANLVAAVLTGAYSGAPTLFGLRLAVLIAQQRSAWQRYPPRLYLLMLGARSACSDAAPPASAASHGAAWGLSRVLRLELPALRVQAAEAAGATSAASASHLGTLCCDPSHRSPLWAEPELSWRGDGVPHASRLRRLLPLTEERSPGGLPCEHTSVYLVTGGLGGLGLRASTLLAESGATRMLLASRTSRISRTDQGLEARLRSLGRVAAVLSCDTADPGELGLLASACTIVAAAASPLGGVLHAAGAAEAGLIGTVRAQQSTRLLAAKAGGAWHLQCATTRTPLDAFLLFSSVGSGIGNVGQGNYAAANASLDSRALSQRAHGMTACSLQWPLVTGAGMGAAALAAHGDSGACRCSFAGAASISLEQYAACLSTLQPQMMPAGLGMAVPLAHPEAMTESVADASDPRFAELTWAYGTPAAPVAATNGTLPSNGIRHYSHASVSAPAAVQAESDLAAALLALPSTQRPESAMQAVLRVSRELMGCISTAAALHADTEFAEAGMDSLAATELAVRLRALSGMALAPTLVMEQTTPRAVAAHLLHEMHPLVQGPGCPSAASASCASASASSGRWLAPGATSPATHYAETTVHRPLGSAAARLSLVLPSELPTHYPQRRVRVLFLHGQGTTASLARQLLEMRGWLDPSLPFAFVLPDGPHAVEAHTHTDAWAKLGLRGLVASGAYDPSAEQRMWGARFDQFAHTFAARNPAVVAQMHAAGTPIDAVIKEHGAFSTERWEQTIEYLKQVIEAHGPFDGVGGFSEGAATAHALLRLQHAGINVGLGSVRFCLALSPWTSPAADARRQLPLAKPLPVRLLLTLGRRDLEMFQEAAPVFEQEFASARRYEHDGEHVYPLVSAQLRDLCFEFARSGGMSDQGSPSDEEQAAPHIALLGEDDGENARQVLPRDPADASSQRSRVASLIRLVPRALREGRSIFQAWMQRSTGPFNFAFGFLVASFLVSSFLSGSRTNTSSISGVAAIGDCEDDGGMESAQCEGVDHTHVNTSPTT